MPSFKNTIFAVSGLLASALALPAGMSANPADPMNPRALGSEWCSVLCLSTTYSGLRLAT